MNPGQSVNQFCQGGLADLFSGLLKEDPLLNSELLKTKKKNSSSDLEIKRKRGFQVKLFVWCQEYEPERETENKKPSNEEENIRVELSFFNALASKFINYGPKASMPFKRNMDVTFLDILEGLPFYIFFKESEKDQKRIADMSKKDKKAKEKREEFAREMRIAVILYQLVNTENGFQDKNP